MSTRAWRRPSLTRARAPFMGSHLGAVAAIRRFGSHLVPVVFIAIGAFILTRSAIT